MKNLTLATLVSGLILCASTGGMAQVLDYQSSFAKNTTGATETLSFTDDVTFSPTNFEPSMLDSFFSGSVGNSSRVTTATGSLTATIELKNSATSTTVIIPDVTLTSGLITTLPGKQPTTFSVESLNYPDYLVGPSGVFDELIVDVSAVLSPGAFVAFLGEADVVPEPSSTALMLGGIGFLALILFRRHGNRPTA